jgi:hypothetical protein
MKRFLASLMVGLVLAACHSVPPPVVTTERARFYLESTDGATELLTLPQSGVQISVMPKPVFTEYDLASVDLAQAELGQCLAFQFTPAAARDLQKLTSANPGRRLVLVLGGVAFGARRIEQPLDHGIMFVFVEVPDSALPALVASLKETSATLQAPAAK